MKGGIMEDFTKLACGCYVGFDVYSKPMWGKQCPLHKAAPDMYEALKAVDEYLSAPYPENMKLKQIAADKLVSALAKAEVK